MSCLEIDREWCRGAAGWYGSASRDEGFMTHTRDCTEWRRGVPFYDSSRAGIPLGTKPGASSGVSETVRSLQVELHA